MMKEFKPSLLDSILFSRFMFHSAMWGIPLLLAVVMIGCDALAPGHSKAKTEKKQLEEQRTLNELTEQQLRIMEKQNVALERIADALEKTTER